MALLHLTAITPNDIRIFGWLGGGDAGDVYEAKLASFAEGTAVALKVFKPYSYPKCGYVLSKAGRELSPFDRELKAYSVIGDDSEAQLNPPVVEAYGWFEIPAQLRIGRFQLSAEYPLKVIAKELVKGPPFNFQLVPPQEMIGHRNMLNRLQIYDTDINEENFLQGRLADLSATYVVSDLKRPGNYNLNNQCPMLKEVILRHHGIFSNIVQPPASQIEQEWETFLETFKTNPNLLSRAAHEHRERTIIVQID